MKKFVGVFSLFEWLFILIAYSTIITLGVVYYNGYLSIIEMLATLAGITAVMLNLKTKKYAFAVYSVYVSIYGAVAFINKQYGEGILNLCYNLPLYIYTLYGFYFSKKKGADKPFEIHSIGWKFWVCIIFAVGAITVGYGFILKLMPDSRLPFYNSLATSLALVASLLAAKTSREQWIFWTLYAIVGICIWTTNFIQTSKGLNLIVLNILFIVTDIYGLLKWYGVFDKKKRDNSNDNKEEIEG